MVAAIMLMLPAAGCASRLSSNFDEREVQEKAEEIAELSCTGKIGEAYGMLSEMMKAQITEDQIRAGIEGTIEPLGISKRSAEPISADRRTRTREQNTRWPL